MTETKTCFKCNETKPVDDFYKHPAMADGRLGKCKECTKRDSTERRNRKIEEVREYDRQRQNLPHRVAARVIHFTQWKKDNPEEYKAHTAVHNAVRDGKLIKLPCRVCGSEKVHGHHEDYSKPLDVDWLCAIHHKERHRELGRGFGWDT